MALVSFGKVAVAVAGTPQLIDASGNGRVLGSIIIQPLSGNTQKVYLGLAGMNKATGANVICALSAGQLQTIPLYQSGTVATQLYLDADVSTEAAYVTVEVL